MHMSLSKSIMIYLGECSRNGTSRSKVLKLVQMYSGKIFEKHLSSLYDF